MDKIEKLKQMLPAIKDSIELRKESPKSLCGSCPKCGGDDRFVYRTNNGRWWCRQCNEKGGDVIDFHAWIEGTDVKGLIKKYLPKQSSQKATYKKTKPLPFKHYKLGFPVEKYKYTDAAGKALYYNCRFELPDRDKTFRQCSADGRAWSVKNIKTKVPYQLPRVIGANTVFILNGEKACHRMNDIGQVGTCCVAGEGNWTRDLNRHFKDKEIILVPDNDDKGRKHVEKVYHELKDIAASIKLLELPGLPGKGDFVEWLDTFDDMDLAAERLAIMVENAGPYEPLKKATIEDTILEIGRFCELDMAERQEYLSPWVKEGSIGLISGWRGTGKTWFAMGILNAVSRGESFGPWECKVSVPCLLLDGEMPAQDIVERSHSLGLTSGRENPFYIYSDAHANRLGLPRAHLANEGWRQEMKRILITRSVKLWVIDNIASLASGLKENVKEDWDPVNDWLLGLRFAGISTILLHHVGKEGSQRGTSGREDNIDTSIIIKSPKNYSPEEGARFIVRFTKSRVKMSALHLVADTEFKLIHDESKKLVWSWSNVKGERKKEIIKMLDEGFDYDTIKEGLGLNSKGYITKVKKEAIKDGYLTENSKLTQTGFSYILG